MIMKYCPPFIFAHRCYLERGEQEMAREKIEAKFGKGGMHPGLEDRWFRGQTVISQLESMGIDKTAYGTYYGFRTRDDQMLFFMMFEGQMRKAS